MLRLETASPEDAEEIAVLRVAVAEHLTSTYGRGHWSSTASLTSVLNSVRKGNVFVRRERGRIIATLSLATKKPWAIDPAYFTAVAQPLYLTDMAVAPDLQHRGIGRRCLKELERLARSWPADAIRLDAYDAPAGAGGFYEKCGYREVGRVVYRKVPLVYFESVM